MNIILLRICRNKYGYAVLFSLFLYLIGAMSNETNRGKQFWYAVGFVVCIGRLLKLVSRIKLAVIFLVLFAFINLHNYLLPQYEWVVKVINLIKNMDSTILMSLLILSFYALISIVEWYAKNRRTLFRTRYFRRYRR